MTIMRTFTDTNQLSTLSDRVIIPECSTSSHFPSFMSFNIVLFNELYIINGSQELTKSKPKIILLTTDVAVTVDFDIEVTV